MRVRTQTAKHERVAHSRLPDRPCGVGLVVQNTLMVRITQSASTILIAMLLNSLVGIVIFVTMLLLRQGVAKLSGAGPEREVVDADPRPAGVLFVFASISGYQNVGAATTIAVLVASQLVGGLIMDLVRAHGVLRVRR
ncbi:DMT family transporter [Klebsiella pneumoniae]|nr:DMT family transporter [Klebsiella pneumoniae]